MSALRELQLDFARALFDERHAQVFSRKIRRSGLGGERRLRIHRNNVRTSLRETLAAIYPVTARLVGDGFFRQTAGRYVREEASTSGDIRRYGGTFPDFLAALPGFEELAWLPGVARLEWAWHCVFHSEVGSPLDLAALAAVAAEHYPGLRFRLQPAARILKSDYPVLQIWQLNQPDWQGDQAVDLYEGGVNLLIRRRNREVAVERLTAGEYRLLDGMARGECLADAIGAAVLMEAGLDSRSALGRFFREGLLVDFIPDARAAAPAKASFHSHPEV